MAMSTEAAETAGQSVKLVLGPILFHWPPEKRADFYARIADEAPVDVVCLGEVICSKRAPFSAPHDVAIAERLQRAGKTVVFSSLAEVMLRREREMTAGLCTLGEYAIEANDASAFFHLSGRPHRVGPLLNVYNEETLRYLAQRGAVHFSLPPELPRERVRILASAARELNVGIEIQAFGRLPLALSARCYHARAHGRTKDNCQFVCENDRDGMTLRTLEGKEFLAVNGVQTLSHAYHCLLTEMPDMAAIGVTHVRLSPHTLDMAAIARLFRDVLDGAMHPKEAEQSLLAFGHMPAIVNGFWNGQPGYLMVAER
jgi:collagenase-like PrtC family protease